jgi:hypothetical protein
MEFCGGVFGIKYWNLFSSKTISSKWDSDLDLNRVCSNNVSKSGRRCFVLHPWVKIIYVQVIE